MNKKILNGIKIGLIVVASLIVISILLHLTVNYLVPFISSIHNKGGGILSY